MTFHVPIAQTTVGLQSVALMGKAAGMAKSAWGSTKSGSKKLVRGFTDIMVGTALIGPTAGIVGKL